MADDACPDCGHPLMKHLYAEADNGSVLWCPVEGCDCMEETHA